MRVRFSGSSITGAISTAKVVPYDSAVEDNDSQAASAIFMEARGFRPHSLAGGRRWRWSFNISSMRWEAR